jgi:hypothetical protein
VISERLNGIETMIREDRFRSVRRSPCETRNWWVRSTFVRNSHYVFRTVAENERNKLCVKLETEDQELVIFQNLIQCDPSALTKRHGTNSISHVIWGGRAIIPFWTFSCCSLTISLSADGRRPDRWCPHAIYWTCDMKRSLFLMRRKKTVTWILPMARNLHAVVPDDFTPIYVRTSKGDQVTRYCCTKQTSTMTGEIRRCS